MTPYEIPLSPTPQRISIALAGITRVLQVYWCGPAACWVMDLMDVDGALLIGAIPLVTGCDLLGQYEYLNLGGQLEVQSDSDLTLVPDFDSLGVSGHLYFVVK